MKQIIAYIFLIGILVGCSESNSQSQNEGITITGTVTNAPEGLIILEKLQRTSTEPLDTIEVKDDNTYSLNFNGEAGFYRVNFFNKQAATVVLDQDDLIIDFDGNSQARSIQPTGSREMDQIEAFYKAINDSFGPREQTINNDFVAANEAGDTEKADAARDAYMELQKEKQLYSAELIRQNEVNLGTYQLVSSLDKDTQLELVDSLAQVLNTMYPGRFYIEELVSNMEKARATSIGVVAPEINLPNPEGEEVALSSLRGKVVLVDFWAQWCKPCRMENPNVVSAYNKFKDKGFTVYGVSLDRTKDKWLQAIEEDGLTWTHVSDLKYFNSVAAETYGINAIPFSILLDRDGKIIAKNLRGKNLDDTLEEYFATEGGM
jgi:peroxiredoxin